MATPMKQDLIHDSLYEIPSCTICLQELNQDIVSLACGHCFHFLCIDQHFEYRGTCPNCQKRAGPKEMRTVLYQVVPNTKANDQFLTVLSSLNITQRKQVQQLLREVKLQTQKAERLRGNIQQAQKDLKKQVQANSTLREDINRQITENNVLKCQNVQMKKVQEAMCRDLSEAQEYISNLKNKLQNYQQKDKQYQEFKRFREIMNENSREIVNYKLELEKRDTPHEERARLFYDMLLLKNLDFLKNKEKLGEYPDIILQKENQIARLRGTIESIKKDLREANDKKNAERKKYEELKKTFRVVCDKARLKGCLDIPEMEESSQSSINIPKTQPLHAKVDFQLPQQQASFKKPIFNMGSSFGGIKKKDDRNKLY